MDVNTWWIQELKADFDKGGADADKGIHDPPYPGSDDPGDQDQNLAYHKGWRHRRMELGSKFEWK